MDPSVSETSGSSNHLLAADALRADPRIAEARRLIAEAAAEHAATLNQALPANPKLAADYQSTARSAGRGSRRPAVLALSRLPAWAMDLTSSWLTGALNSTSSAASAFTVAGTVIRR